MKPIVIQIYAILICFIAATSFVFALDIFLYDIVEINWPEFASAGYSDDPKHIERIGRYAVQSMIKTFIVMLVSCVFYLPHWRLANRKS